MRDLLDDVYVSRFAKSFDDPWIANSLMQKAIRRGDTEIAQRAALSFHALCGSAIWRRLLIIAVEDIGIGSPETVIETVETCTNRALRKANGGNIHVIFHLARRLAEAVKDRSADHLIITAAEHPRLEAARRRMGSLTPGGRLELLSDLELPLPVRATAAWFTSGLEWDRNRRITGSDFTGLERTYLDLGAPFDLCAQPCWQPSARESRWLSCCH